MARIDWAILCDSAFLDKQDRLCIIGIIGKFPVAAVPLTVRQVTLVAHLTDIQPVDEVAIVVGVVDPSGGHGARMGSDDVTIEMSGHYILTTLRNVPLSEEGVYHFQIQLRGQPVRSLDIPVLATSRAGYSQVQ